MFLAVEKWYGQRVAPFAGAWIEILFGQLSQATAQVAPFAGAWIEIQAAAAIEQQANRRSLRGSVD